MTYETVDPIFTKWASEHDLGMLTQFGGREQRFCYVTGGPQECFQIAVEPPGEGTIVVNVWSIETIDDVDLHACWSVPFDGLANALDTALDQIRAWDQRSKGHLATSTKLRTDLGLLRC
jgi:hypothetical protein